MTPVWLKYNYNCYLILISDVVTNNDGNYVGPTEAVKVTTPSEGIGFNETPPEPLRAEVNMPEVTTIARTLINNDLLPEGIVFYFGFKTVDIQIFLFFEIDNESVYLEAT